MTESLAGALPTSSLTALHDEGQLWLPVRYAGRVLSAIRDAIVWVSHSLGVRLHDATPPRAPPSRGMSAVCV